MSEGYQAVRDGGAGLIDLSERGRIRVSGSEAVMFLNGLITNDMKTLAENRWMPAVFPTVQGRVIGAVRVVRGTGSSFLIDSDRESHDAVLKTISRFTMAGDFRVTDVTSETALLSIQGAGARDVVSKIVEIDLPRDGATELVWQDAAVAIIRASHTGEDGYDFVIDAARASDLRQALEAGGAQSVSADVFEVLRVEAGISRFGRDMDDTTVVPETNLDHAVSYTKGCYVGQEIIVRIKHRGHVAKKLTGLKFETDGSVEAGAIITATDGKEIGRVTSTAVSPKVGSIGLGYVRYEYLAPRTNVLVADGVNATVTELPFIHG
jgi:tRNA-modifying protein YgfZ